MLAFIVNEVRVEVVILVPDVGDVLVYRPSIALVFLLDAERGVISEDDVKYFVGADGVEAVLDGRFYFRDEVQPGQVREVGGSDGTLVGLRDVATCDVVVGHVGGLDIIRVVDDQHPLVERRCGLGAGAR